jgi:ketosteroid isomerase-like protein
MPHDNLEITRRAFEAFNGGDLDLLASEFWDEQIEWQTSREDPDAATHRGHEGVRRYVDQWCDSFDGLRADIDESVAAGEDRVFLWVHWTGRGRGSGIDTEWWLAIVYTYRNGRILRAEEYFDRTEGREAAGLPE